MIKKTYSEEVWVNGNKVSEVTLEENDIMNNITSYMDKVREFEKIVDAHKGEKMVNYYELSTHNIANGEAALLTYYYAPAGLTILKGVTYQRVKEEE
jgi:hypothetical protein